MPCEVCGAHPTWYDLSECNRSDCPWELNPGKAIPPLPKKMWNPPPVQPVSAPKPASKTGSPQPPLPAVLSPTSPQPHSWEGRVEKLMEGMTPPSVAAAEKETGPKSWANLVKEAPKLATAPVKPAVAPVAKAATAPTTGAATSSARSLSTSQQQDDFDEIMRHVDMMAWAGSHGPTCTIQTKIDWTNPDCRTLYLYVKQELHDKPFKVGKRTLYYYVGKIGNWGKAGFRISGHTKPVAKLSSAQTCGVLHIDN